MSGKKLQYKQQFEKETGKKSSSSPSQEYENSIKKDNQRRIDDELGRFQKGMLNQFGGATSTTTSASSNSSVPVNRRMVTKKEVVTKPSEKRQVKKVVTKTVKKEQEYDEEKEMLKFALNSKKSEMNAMLEKVRKEQSNRKRE